MVSVVSASLDVVVKPDPKPNITKPDGYNVIVAVRRPKFGAEAVYCTVRNLLVPAHKRPAYCFARQRYQMKDCWFPDPFPFWKAKLYSDQ